MAMSLKPVKQFIEGIPSLSKTCVIKNHAVIARNAVTKQSIAMLQKLDRRASLAMTAI
jgi:hypothetical protein